MNKRSTKRSVMTVLMAVFVAGALMVPAMAGNGNGGGGSDHKKGGHATIQAFDAATMVLTLETKKAGVLTFTVSPDVKVGVIQHGKNGGDGKGGYSPGTLEDLQAGLKVSNMKVRDELVTKIIVKLPKVEPCDDGDEGTDEATDDGTEDDGTVDDGTEGDGTVDDGTVDDGTVDDGTVDDGTDEIVEDDGTDCVDDEAADDGTDDGADDDSEDDGEDTPEVEPTPTP